MTELAVTHLATEPIAALDGRLRTLAPVSLTELGTHAELLTRVDRKYVLPARTLPVLAAQLDPSARLLTIDGDTAFEYASVYFDTDDLASYRSTALRRRRRFKVRTRTYLDSGECWLEVKTRGPRRTTVKSRQPHPAGAPTALSADGAAFVADTLAQAHVPPHVAARLHPTLRTRFRRRTLWLPHDGARVTIDDALQVDTLTGSTPVSRRHFSDVVVVETKSGQAPSQVDRLLWSVGLRPTRMSKFGVGMAVLDPRLPANRWRRTIDNSFGPDDRSTS